jgi:murein DD-endopeptidase MepM/ murein hydrolase activator NlpD
MATSTTLSPGTLVQLARNAGFSSAMAPIMAAIALAESGGNPNSTNPNDNGGRQTSWGLWQISDGTHNMPQGWSDPQTNANMAYQKYLSQGLGAWGTYTSGKYKDFMNAIQGATNTASETQPWYTFPRIDNFGQIDPQGNFWKPDSNILTPPGYPITALLSGTVTSVQNNTSWGGQTAITVKLDNPVNSEATHTFYEHLHDATVQVGQHLNSGDLLGHANYTGEGANLGFGFFSGDVYPNGSAWSQLQQDLAPGGAGLLNPTNILNAAKNGTLTIAGFNTSTLGYDTSGSSVPVIGPLIDWLNQRFSGLFDWISKPTRVIKLVVGVLMIGIALYMLVGEGAEKVVNVLPPEVKDAAKVAAGAAEA